jgi:hypothetical protein
MRNRVIASRVIAGRVADWAWFAPLSLCFALAGCAGAVDGPLLFTDPGKYQFHNCEQLATAAKGQIQRQQELKDLINKAEQGAGGIIVSLMAYRSDYVAVEEDLRMIETTARNKNCATPTTWQSNAVIR